MPIDKLYDLAALNFLGTGAWRLDELTDGGIDTGISMHVEHGAGNPNPTFAGVMNQEPMLRGTTSAIAKFLTNVSAFNGLAIKSGGITSVEAYLSPVEDLGERQSGNVKFKAAATRGLVVPRQLTANQNQAASLSFDVYIEDDGTNPAMVFTDNVAPLAAATITEQFTLGPVSCKGTAVKGNIGVTIDFGLSIEVTGTDGKVFPQHVGILRRAPVLTVRNLDPRLLSTIGLSGSGQNATPSTLVLRKMLNADTRTPEATAEHIKLTIPANQGHWRTSGYSGGNLAYRNGDLICTPVDGASPMFAISVASAV